MAEILQSTVRRIDAHLSDADAVTLHLEADPTLRSTIVAVAMLDRLPDPDRLRARIDLTLRVSPGFRSVLRPPRVPLAPPRLVADPEFDLDWHVRRMALSAPSGDRGAGTAEVLAAARRFGTTAFDPARPLWELYLIDGLDPSRSDGAGAAFVMKVHHALTDGVGGIRLLAHLVDLEAEPVEEPPRSPRLELTTGPSGPLGEVIDGLLFRGREVGRVTASAARGLPRFLCDAVTRPVATGARLRRDVVSVARFVQPVLNGSTLLAGRGLHWRYDVLDVPTEALAAAGHMVGGGLNDAFLGGLTGGLARYHHRRSAVARDLVITMPINLRGTDEWLPTRAGGNRITLARFGIPMHIDDPWHRMLTIDRITRAWRAEPVLAWAEQVAAVLNLLPNAVLGGILNQVDVVASNVEGFPLPVFVAGAEVLSFRAFGPPIGAAVNVTLLSYRGTCHLGVTTDRVAVPDPDLLLACLREGFDEIAALGAPLREGAAEHGWS